MFTHFKVCFLVILSVSLVSSGILEIFVTINLRCFVDHKYIIPPKFECYKSDDLSDEYDADNGTHAFFYRNSVGQCTALIEDVKKIAIDCESIFLHILGAPSRRGTNLTGAYLKVNDTFH